MTIKGRLCEHLHAKAVFGHTKSQNQSPKWRFFGN